MDWKELFNKLTDTEDSTDSFSFDDISAGIYFAAVACIPFLFWVPLVMAKDSAFGRYWANQGLALTIVGAVCIVIGKLLGWIPLLGGLISLLLGIFMLFEIITGAMTVFSRRAKELPLIGGFLRVF